MNERDESWVAEAIAEQEEHIRRVTSCSGQVGRSHAFRPHGDPADPRLVVSRCVVCGVTATRDDWQRLVAGRAGRGGPTGK